MSSLVSSILQVDDMPFIGSSKRKSLPTGTSSGGVGGTPRFAFQNHHSSAEYHVAHYGSSPVPTPSTSWTSEMSMLADKIRDDDMTRTKQVIHLDRRSISQGLKLVSIAADEYDGGNETVALDIYLTGIDKILMALPNKTDPKTKLALREKLISVEERVGILNLHQRLPPSDAKACLQSYIVSRITTTMSSFEQEQPDPVNRFKRMSQMLVNFAVACAIYIKQSPIPDILYFLFGYFIQLMLWLDRQYHFSQKAQDFGVECVKWILEADEEYRLHELVSETIYTLIAAGLKAVVAFKETPPRRGNPTKHRW